VTPDDHRATAVSTYNACWALLDAIRTSEQDCELLTCAFTSRYHWAQVGGPSECAVADWMVSRCAAATGDAPLALAFARASRTHDESGFEPWLRASLIEGLARAHDCAGAVEDRDRLVAEALAVLEQEPDPENAQVIRDQLADLVGS